MPTPSLLMIPSAFKSGVLASVLPSDGAGDFTVSRPSIATRVNADGIIETMAANVARLDYSDGGCPVLLTEPQSTNLIEYSEDFSNDYWVKTLVSISPNNAISPKGDSSASTLLNGVGSSHLSRQFSLTNGINYTFSFFVKKVDDDYYQMQIFNSNYSERVNFTFEFSTETITILDMTTIVAYENSSFKKFNNDWYNLTVTIKSFDSSLNVRNRVGLPNNGTDGSSIQIWGAQIEQQSYATSYIKTDGTTVTRLADVVTGAGDANTFNSVEGVFYIETSAIETTPNSNRFIYLSDGTTTNRIYFNFSIINEVQVVCNVGGVLQVNVRTAPMDLTVNRKYVVKWKLNDFAVYIDGVETLTDTTVSAFPPNTLNELRLSDLSNTSNFRANTKELRVYDSIASAQIDLPYIN